MGSAAAAAGAASGIKVLVVDDSAVVRQMIGAILARERRIVLAGAVADPVFAMQRMRTQWPDVIVLDIEMPRMDGLTFLRRVMAERPTPVIICSSLTQEGAQVTLQALAAGAFAVIAKPKLGVPAFLIDAAADLVKIVKAAADAKPANLVFRPAERALPLQAPAASAAAPAPDFQTTEKIVALGASTGGTQALEAVLAALPAVSPGIVIVQHMPEKFTTAFAARLDSVCRIEVREARSGDRMLPGLALLAPGGRHMRVLRSGARYHVEVSDGPLVNHHRPSVDILFRSVAGAAGSAALGIIMTGMGDDGARGLADMREAGARTVAQDQASSVVFGMPKEAIRRGAAAAVLPLAALAAEIARFRSP